MNPLDISWSLLKTMSPAERARVGGMEARRKELGGPNTNYPKPTPKDIFNQPSPTSYPPDVAQPSPNDHISWEKEAQRLGARFPPVTQEDWDNLIGAPPQPSLDPSSGRPISTPERVGPGDMTPDAIMRYTRPQLEQMIQLIHNELTRRQDNKVGVR